MLHKLVKRAADFTLGNRFVKNLFLETVGYRWNGWMLGLFGYRAVHMVDKSESCVLAGIYNASTIFDFSSAIGEKGTVIVIEANPQNAKRLADETSHLSNVKVLNKAIWNSSGEMEFICSISDKDQGYNRLNSKELQEFPSHLDDSPQKVMVQTDTIDNILKGLNISKIHHVNLTINGAELQALDGVSELRKVCPDMRIYINSEIPDPGLRVIDGLKEIGFKVYTSKLIRVVNTKIKLIRIYACN